LLRAPRHVSHVVLLRVSRSHVRLFVCSLSRFGPRLRVFGCTFVTVVAHTFAFVCVYRCSRRFGCVCYVVLPVSFGRVQRYTFVYGYVATRVVTFYRLPHTTVTFDCPFTRWFPVYLLPVWLPVGLRSTRLGLRLVVARLFHTLFTFTAFTFILLFYVTVGWLRLVARFPAFVCWCHALADVAFVVTFTVYVLVHVYVWVRLLVTVSFGLHTHTYAHVRLVGFTRFGLFPFTFGCPVTVRFTHVYVTVTFSFARLLPHTVYTTLARFVVRLPRYVCRLRLRLRVTHTRCVLRLRLVHGCSVTRLPVVRCSGLRLRVCVSFVADGYVSRVDSHGSFTFIYTFVGYAARCLRCLLRCRLRLVSRLRVRFVTFAGCVRAFAFAFAYTLYVHVFTHVALDLPAFRYTFTVYTVSYHTRLFTGCYVVGLSYHVAFTLLPVCGFVYVRSRCYVLRSHFRTFTLSLLLPVLRYSHVCSVYPPLRCCLRTLFPLHRCYFTFVRSHVALRCCSLLR